MDIVKNFSWNFFLVFIIILLIPNNGSFGSDVNELKKIQSYLNEIHTLEANILQTDPDGNETLGTIKLKKPGKLRIEYDSEYANHLIVASDGFLAIIDFESNAEPLRYPTNETPLKYLSNNDIDLLNPEIYSQIYISENLINLEISEVRKSLGLGNIILKFKKDPISIIGWEIPINSSQKTTITLKNLRINSKLKDELFFISAELMKFYNKIDK